METQPNTHLRIHGKFHLIIHPDIKGDRNKIGEALAREAYKLPDTFLLSPLLLSPDKKIFFHGGDVLPFTHLPMPWCGDEEWIGQYPGIREVEFVPLFCFLMSDDLYQTLKPKPYFEDNVIRHADFVMEAKELGARCYATPLVHITYPHAYKPKAKPEDFKADFTDQYELFNKKWGDKIDAQYRLPVCIHGIVGFSGGYNFHTYNLEKELFLRRIRVHHMYIGGDNAEEPECGCTFVDDHKGVQASRESPQITLVHGTNAFKNSGKYKIAFTTTEVSGIPDNWVKALNEMDEVWSTSEFAKQAFLNSGVERPIYVIGEGVDPAYFHPAIKPFDYFPKDKFVFLTNFAWGRRKGVDVLMEAFQKEFSRKDNAVLIIKTLGSYHGHNIRKEFVTLKDPRSDAEVLLWHADLEKFELGRMYTGADCFVWPSRGEGYGLPAIEALSCGVPVIASNWSSHLEFLVHKGAPLNGVLLIDGKVEPYDKGDSIFYPGFNWFNPSVESLQTQMRMIYDNKEFFKQMALDSSQHIRDNFNWRVSTQRVIDRLEEIHKKLK